MMLPLTLGPAIDRARRVGTDAEVWAILRFDRDNNRMEVFWSERNVANAQIPDGHGGMRAYGSHAEPVLIRGFAQAIVDHGPPNVVEIYLSRSPCDVSVAAVIRNENYPIGCSHKLAHLAGLYPEVQFNIFYDVLYAGNPVRPDGYLRAQSSAGVLRLNQAPNIQAGPTDRATLQNP